MAEDVVASNTTEKIVNFVWNDGERAAVVSVRPAHRGMMMVMPLSTCREADGCHRDDQRAHCGPPDDEDFEERTERAEIASRRGSSK